MIPLLLILIAAISYFLGSLSSPILLAKYVFHKDISRQNRGVVGYNTFVRNFGQKWGLAVIGADVVKSIAAVVIGGLLMRIPGDGFPVIGSLFAGFCLVLGDIYPVQRKFRGGKGAASAFAMMWCISWPTALISTLLAGVIYLLWKRVSLVSILTSIICPSLKSQ